MQGICQMTSLCTRQTLVGFCRTCKQSNIYFLQLFFNFTTLCNMLTFLVQDIVKYWVPIWCTFLMKLTHVPFFRIFKNTALSIMSTPICTYTNFICPVPFHAMTINGSIFSIIFLNKTFQFIIESRVCNKNGKCECKIGIPILSF